MLKGTNQELGRMFNRRIVLEAIRVHGPVARNEIATRIGLTVQTVSTLVRELEQDGYILSLAGPPRGRGAPPRSLILNPEGGFAIGIQLTPIGIGAALVNLAGDIVARHDHEGEQLPPDEAFHIIAGQVSELKALRPGARILGIGMTLPGPFGIDSMSHVGATTMAGWQGIDIAGRLAAAGGLPAFVDADTAAAALGEQLYGLGTELHDYYYLFFGVGLGGTLVHDGIVMRGHWGNAGEIGHISLVPDGEPCSCGNKGCLERYVSLDALRRSGMAKADWVRSIAPLFASAVRTIENLFDPEAIVLGGIAPPDLLGRLAGEAAGFGNSVAVRQHRTTPRLLVARAGPGSVLRGAAALAVRGALSPRLGSGTAGTATHQSAELRA